MRIAADVDQLHSVASLMGSAGAEYDTIGQRVRTTVNLHDLPAGMRGTAANYTERIVVRARALHGGARFQSQRLRATAYAFSAASGGAWGAGFVDSVSGVMDLLGLPLRVVDFATGRWRYQQQWNRHRKVLQTGNNRFHAGRYRDTTLTRLLKNGPAASFYRRATDWISKAKRVTSSVTGAGASRWLANAAKTGRVVGGKALPAVGMAFDAESARGALERGDYIGVALYGASVAAGGVLVVGAIAGGTAAAPAVVIAAGGVMAGAVVYEHREAIGNAAKGAYNAAKGAGSNAKKAIGGMLKKLF